MSDDGETWRCPGCRDTVAPMGMCQKCGVFGLRYLAAPSPALTREALGKALDRTFPEQRDGKAPHEYADLLLMNLGGTPPPAPTSTREEPR